MGKSPSKYSIGTRLTVIEFGEPVEIILTEWAPDFRMFRCSYVDQSIAPGSCWRTEEEISKIIKKGYYTRFKP